MEKNSRYLSKNGLLVVLAIVLSIAFVGSSLINYSMTRASIRQEIISKDLPLTRDNIYSDIVAEIIRPILVGSSMASDSFLADWVQDGEENEDRIIRYLEKIRNRYGFFSTFFVSANTLNYYHFKGVHKTISPKNSHDVWYYNFVASKRDYILEVDTDEASQNTLTVFINYKVYGREGKFLGVTGVGVKVDTLTSLIDDYKRKYDRVVYLTDNAGVVQVHRDKELIDRKSITHLHGMESLAGEILNLREEPADYQFNRDGQNILLTVRYIKQLDWFLFVEQNETEALTQAKINLAITIGTGLAVSILVIGLTLITINRYQSRIEDLATRDTLTGLANRRMLEHEFSRVVHAHDRSRQPFSVILMDLDGFKRVNDLLGHLVGDRVLKQIAEMIIMTVRPTDVVARWGGDEFVVLTPLSAGDAEKIGERIRKNVEQWSVAEVMENKDDPRKTITLCSGITEFQPGDDLDDMLHRADQVMYRCKEEGGNMVRVSDFLTDNL